mmetsp:Transcript_42475/g.56047  ORF Transcript_42475/g.56047 Transcript_42475/m.56047 type:complete len:94 (+) Transcript_42475:1115-1396(+)
MERHQAERQRCREEYSINECEPENRREHLEDFCQQKELCMNTGPNTTVKMVNVAGGLMAQALNTFIGSIEHRVLAVLLVCLILGAWVLSKYVS